MQIDPESKQKIQLVLAIAIAVAAVRAGYIVYQRHSGQTKEAQKKMHRQARACASDLEFRIRYLFNDSGFAALFASPGLATGWPSSCFSTLEIRTGSMPTPPKASRTCL